MMKENVTNRCYRRIRLILKTELNVKNNITLFQLIYLSYTLMNVELRELGRSNSKTRKVINAVRTVSNNRQR